MKINRQRDTSRDNGRLQRRGGSLEKKNERKSTQSQFLEYVCRFIVCANAIRFCLERQFFVDCKQLQPYHPRNVHHQMNVIIGCSLDISRFLFCSNCIVHYIYWYIHQRNNNTPMACDYDDDQNSFGKRSWLNCV